MNIIVTETDNISIIKIKGRIDINSSGIIETVGQLIKDEKKYILLNLGGVTMVDYGGISILAIAYKDVINHNGKLKFCNVTPGAEEALRLVRLDCVFEIYKDEGTALRAFRHKPPVDEKAMRRRFDRADLHIDVEFTGAKNEKGGRPVWYSAKLLNMSGEGLFLYTKKLLPIGEKIRLKIDLSDGKAFEAEGTVIWIADKILQPQSSPGMGVFIKRMGRREQDRVLKFINSRLVRRSSI